MKTSRQVRPNCERTSSRIQPSNEADRSRGNARIPLIRACAACEQELGIKHTGERVTHGFCRRHAIAWLRATGLPVVKIEAAIARLGACCPDLGQVRAGFNQAFSGSALTSNGGER